MLTTLLTPQGPIQGRLFSAIGHNANICFVPLNMIANWSERDYTEEQWASFNCGIQTEPVGSHLLPDLQSPVKEVDSRWLDNMQSQARTFHTPPSR
jgi:hypothetical protein